MNLKKNIITIYHNFLKDSFYRNSIYLLVNMGFSTIAGFLFVLVCTHLYTQKDFGYATSLIGALGVATAFSNIGMSRTVVRFLGKSMNQSQDLVTKIMLVVSCSLISGIILSFFFHSFGIKHTDLITVLIFISTVFSMSIKNLFDNVFIAIRKSSGTLIESTLFSITKLFFPILVIGSGFIGIFSSQLAGALIAVVASILLLKLKHGFDFKVRPSKSSMNGRWRFALGSYTSDLVGGLPSNILPIIVVAKLGPISGALWYIAMQIINFLLTISSTVNQAMFAEMANAKGNISNFIKKASISMYSLLIPLSIVLFILAPYILKLFHGNYVAAEHVLRLMTIFALIGVANYITGSILLVYKKVIYITFVNIANATVVIFYCLLFAHNLNGIAIGWMLGEVVNFVLFVGGGIFIAHQHNGNLILEEG